METSDLPTLVVVLLGVFALLRVALIGFRAIGTLTRLPTGRTIGPTRSVRGDSGETPTGRRAGPIVHSRRVCKWYRRCCQRFTINSVMKNTTTARVNRIFSASGLSSGL